MGNHNFLHIIAGIVVALGFMQFAWESLSEPSNNHTEPSIDSTEPITPLNLSELITLEMNLQYPMIFPQATSELLEPVLLSLNVNETSQNTRTPLDIVWVLDTSGSMFGEKITLLKDTLRYLITFLTENDRVSIVSFDSSARRLIPLQKVSKANERLFHSIIDNLDAGGLTYIEKGLSEALKVLRERKEKDRISSVFVLSDGLDNDPNAEQAIKNLFSKYNDIEGCSVHTFGYGYDHDPNLMSKIASFRDGNFYFIERLETADESFADALGGLLSVVAERVTLSVKALPCPVLSRVSFEKAFGGELLWRKTRDGWYETYIRQLSSGRNKNYVLMMALGNYLPKDIALNQEGVAIAMAKLRMYEAGTNKLIEKEFELKVNITQNQSEFKRQDPDVKVLLNYYRVRAGEVMLESAKLADQGKYEEGRNKLEDLKSEMGNSTINEDGFVVGTINDLNNTIWEMFPEVYSSLGKHHIQQNSGSYISEKSNPYMNNTALSYNTTNMKQGELVNQTRVRRNPGSNWTNCTNGTNGTNCTNASKSRNITNGTNHTNETSFSQGNSSGHINVSNGRSNSKQSSLKPQNDMNSTIRERV